MSDIWVLSMCSVSEGGGDVDEAELFATEQDALAAVARYEKNNEYWGCVDWRIDRAINPHEVRNTKEGGNDVSK